MSIPHLPNTGPQVPVITYYDEEVTDHVICLVYGKFGSGKTHFAGTFPKPFLIDVERGGKTLARMGKIPGWKVPNERGSRVWNDVMFTLTCLEKKRPPFDQLDVQTIIVDSLSELGELWFQEIIGWPESGVIENKKGDASYDSYARLKQRYRTFVRRVQDMGMHAVFTAGVQGDDDEVTGGAVAMPRILGGYRQEIGHDFDEVYYAECQSVGQQYKYLMHVRQHRIYPAKSRSAITAPIEDPSYEKVLDYYKNPR